MPIYEFLCEDCNRIFSFLARSLTGSDRIPDCPKCGGNRMHRQMSSFATIKASGKAGYNDDADRHGDGSDRHGDEGAAEARMEQALRGVDLEGLDERNPRQIASIMRRLSEASGEPVDPLAEEMMRRLEKGEDIERVAGMFPDEAPTAGGGASHDDGLYNL